MSRAWHGIGRAVYSVVVAGGTGYVDGALTGRLERLIITAPSGSPTLSVAITDTNGRGCFAAGPNTGAEINFDGDAVPLYGKNRITISGATVNGTYTVTAYGLVEGGDWLITAV